MITREKAKSMIEGIDPWVETMSIPFHAGRAVYVPEGEPIGAHNWGVAQIEELKKTGMEIAEVFADLGYTCHVKIPDRVDLFQGGGAVGHVAVDLDSKRSASS